jgi:hypothetical protein
VARSAASIGMMIRLRSAEGNAQAAPAGIWQPVGHARQQLAARDRLEPT